MTHNELLKLIYVASAHVTDQETFMLPYEALLKIVGLHCGTGVNNRCMNCLHGNKCETIQIIEKELS